MKTIGLILLAGVAAVAYMVGRDLERMRHEDVARRADRLTRGMGGTVNP